MYSFQDTHWFSTQHLLRIFDQKRSVTISELSDYITRRKKNLDIWMRYKMVVLVLGYALLWTTFYFSILLFDMCSDRIKRIFDLWGKKEYLLLARSQDSNPQPSEEIDSCWKNWLFFKVLGLSGSLIRVWEHLRSMKHYM